MFFNETRTPSPPVFGRILDMKKGRIIWPEIRCIPNKKNFIST
jgi:hypothetical protein